MPVLFFFPSTVHFALLIYLWEQVLCQLLEKGDLLVTDIRESPKKIKRISFFLLFFYLPLFSLRFCNFT